MCCKRGERSGVRDQKNRHEAFTLVELMVVIVIIGLLAGSASVGVRSYLIKGKQAVARKEIATICTALETYYTQTDRYPSTDQGIALLAEKTDDFPDGLLSKVPMDPWKNPYVYRMPGRNSAYEVISYGADQAEGGEAAAADISSEDIDR